MEQIPHRGRSYNGETRTDLEEIGNSRLEEDMGAETAGAKFISLPSRELLGA